jgi:hypothetical protein
MKHYCLLVYLSEKSFSVLPLEVILLASNAFVAFHGMASNAFSIFHSMLSNSKQ